VERNKVTLCGVAELAAGGADSARARVREWQRRFRHQRGRYYDATRLERERARGRERMCVCVDGCVR